MYLERLTDISSTCLQVLSIKGQWAADQCVQDYPQTPNIHFRTIILLALEKLWGSVGRWATERVQLVTQGELIAEAEVCNLNVGVCVQQEVLRLNHPDVEQRWAERGRECKQRTMEREKGQRGGEDCWMGVRNWNGNVGGMKKYKSETDG